MTRSRFVLRLFVGGVLLLSGVEAFARIALGLGTPPLSIPHPTIEYMFRPNQTVMRFHNRQTYNEVGMRSGALPQDGGVPVILVIGDSVVNGGTQTDQDELATEILRRSLSTPERPVFVGNVAAGSWGPANQLAYLREFGLFGARAAVLVLSSRDVSDVPTFAPLDPRTYPTEAPASALWEGLTHYLPMALPFLQPAKPPASATEPGAALSDLRDLIAEVRDAAVPLCVVHHQTRAELADGPTPEGVMLDTALERAGVPYIVDGPAFQEAVAHGLAPYRDHIHLEPSGQVVLAQVIGDCLRRIGGDPAP